MAGQSRLLTCQRCSGIMERGFVVDEGYGTRGVSKWVAGEPEKSIWTGIRVRRRTQLEIATYRCGRCGYLESYA